MQSPDHEQSRRGFRARLNDDGEENMNQAGNERTMLSENHGTGSEVGSSNSDSFQANIDGLSGEGYDYRGDRSLYFRDENGNVKKFDGVNFNELINKGKTEIWSFGQNTYGELMLGDLTDRRVPQRSDVVDAQNLDIIQVVAGNEHTAFLCSDGSVYTCGFNDSGQCGLGYSSTSVQVPTLVSNLQGKNIKQLFSFNGSEHVIALTASGECYAFGYNLRGQLGLGTVTSVSTPTKIEYLSNKIVTIVSCSYHHTVLTTSDMVTYSFGRNDHGQLGLGDNTDRHMPEVIETLRGRKIQALACGQLHTVFSAMSPCCVLTCGKSDYYQLGGGPTPAQQVRKLPAPVEGPLGGSKSHINRNNSKVEQSDTESRLVIQVAAGYYHTIAITNDGEVYAWGRNDYAQCGLGHKENVPVPTRVEALSEFSIISVKCGCYHSLFLSEDGLVFSAGRGQHGQLGVPFKEESVQQHNTQSPVSMMTSTIATGPGVDFGASATSSTTSSLLHNDGKTSSASGSDSTGQVSAANNTNELYPRMIRALEAKFVAQIAAGFYHSVCLVGPSRESLTNLPSESLSGDFVRLLNQKQASDVTFIVEGRPIYAHRCIIMVRCEPLDKLLNSGLKESFQKEIVINDIQYEIFLAFLEFLYTARVRALTNNKSDTALEFALDLLVVADQYLVSDLKSLCENAVQGSINAENVAFMFKTAHERHAFSLKKRCFDFIMRNFAKVIGTQAFALMPPELIHEVLSAASKRSPVFTT